MGARFSQQADEPAQEAQPAVRDEEGEEFQQEDSVWEQLASSISGLGPSTYTRMRDGMALALSLASRQKRRRATLQGAELELAQFITNNSKAVDFTQMLSPEIVAHICMFVDGEDLIALEQTCKYLNEVVGDAALWRHMLEAKKRQITFVPFISENDDSVQCRNREEKHRYFNSCVWNNAEDLSQALLVAEHSELGGEIHLLEGKYRSLLIEGWDVDVSIIGHGHAVIENSSAWRPPIHICSDSSLNPGMFVREQLSIVAAYMPVSLASISPSHMLPDYLTSLFRRRRACPTVVLDSLTVQVGACAEQLSTFPVYVEGSTHVVVHKCKVIGQRLSAVLVSKGAHCDVVDCDIGGALEDGVFFVSGGGSVRGCRIHDCAMNAVEIRGASGDIVVENNVLTANGCGLHVPSRGQPAMSLEQWVGQIHFRNNQVFENGGPSMRIEMCHDNPHMGEVSGNVLYDNAEHRQKSAAIERALQEGFCTGGATGERHDYQPWYECVTCELDGDHFESGICESCVKKCHANHKTYQRWTHTRAFCDCNHQGQCQCQDTGEN